MGQVGRRVGRLATVPGSGVVQVQTPGTGIVVAMMHDGPASGSDEARAVAAHRPIVEGVRARGAAVPSPYQAHARCS